MNDNDLTCKTIGRARTWNTSVYGVRLMNLHTTRRCLMLTIEDELRIGQPIAALQKELNSVRAETSAFYSYLAAHT